MLPAAPTGLPFVLVDFTRLTITPYVSQAGRLAYALRSTGVRVFRGGRASVGLESAA